MKCVECPLYKFDGVKFYCPGIPYHDFGEEGMFADPDQPAYGRHSCAYARVWLNSVNNRLRLIDKQLKDLNDEIACYRIAYAYSPYLERWQGELRIRINKAESKAGELECIKRVLIKEKSTIVAQLGSLKNL